MKAMRIEEKNRPKEGKKGDTFKKGSDKLGQNRGEPGKKQANTT